MRKGTKKLVVILGVVVGTPLLGYAGFAAYIIASPAIDSYRHQMPFDSEQWKGRSQDAGLLWPTRLRMVDDLRARHLLDGLPSGARDGVATVHARNSDDRSQNGGASGN